MDIPDLVQRALDDEEIQAGVSLGDEDAVCLTPTRTLVYRGEGLLSDEQVSEYSHDVEQITVSEGRRKTKFTLQYIDGTNSFTVPANRGEKVLELFLEGVLRLEEVIESRESILGVYRFSELTVIIAEGRLIKHIGEPVWNEDYEVYDFEAVTRLEFERASVATSIAISVDGRPKRIKVPNDTAPVVRQTLEKALFEYYDVASLEELNRVVDDSTGGGASAVDAAGATDDTDDFAFGDDFDPLVSDDDDPTESVDTQDPLPGATESADAATPDRGTESTEAGPGTETTPPRDDRSTDASESAGATDSGAADTGAAETDVADTRTGREADAGPAGTTDVEQSRTVDTEQSRTVDTEQSRTTDPEPTHEVQTERAHETAAAEPTHDVGRDGERGQTEREPTDATAGSADPAPGSTDPAVTREEFEAVADRLDDLTDAVERQNELLRRQHRAIKKLAKQREQ